MKKDGEVFLCQMCGMCCRNILRYKEILPKLRVLLNDESINFPFEDVNGVCQHLTLDNKCDIYDERPAICNTNIMFPLLAKANGCSIDVILEGQQLSCKINQGLV